MKGFQEFYERSSVEERYRPIIEQLLSEKLNISRDEFMGAMSNLWKDGDEAVIDRTYNLMSEMQVEQMVAELFEKKAPSAQSSAPGQLVQWINQLSVPAEDKVELVKGMMDGSAFTLSKAIQKKGLVDLETHAKTPAAKALLRNLVAWKARPSSKALGAAAAELFFIIAGKNGAVPAKGDAIVDGKNVEIKAYAKTYSWEFTVSGGQNNGVPIRDAFAAAAEKLYKSKGTDFYKKYWTDYEKTPAIGKMPLGLTRTKNTGGNSMHLTAPMNSFCVNLQKHGKMNATQINKWIIDTNRKIMSSRAKSVKIWDGKKFDRFAFLAHWNACAFDYYKKEEGFDKVSIINVKELKMVTYDTGNEMLADWKRLGSKFTVAAIAMNGMPGRNGSVSVGGMKL